MGHKTRGHHFFFMCPTPVWIDKRASVRAYTTHNTYMLSRVFAIANTCTCPNGGNCVVFVCVANGDSVAPEILYSFQRGISNVQDSHVHHLFIDLYVWCGLWSQQRWPSLRNAVLCVRPPPTIDPNYRRVVARNGHTQHFICVCLRVAMQRYMYIMLPIGRDWVWCDRYEIYGIIYIVVETYISYGLCACVFFVFESSNTHRERE